MCDVNEELIHILPKMRFQCRQGKKKENGYIHMKTDFFDFFKEFFFFWQETQTIKVKLNSLKIIYHLSSSFVF